jgi:hypothetical protein
MKKDEWLEQCRQNGSVLLEVVGNYYPYRGNEPHSIGPITAKSAQCVCDTICASIINEESSSLDPSARFGVALERGDVAALSSMLSSTWFGVPESTSCWGVTGFKELVDLLDDPPEYEYGGDE